MTSFRQALVVGVVGSGLSLGCATPVSEGETVIENESEVRVEQYRFRNEVLTVSSVDEGDGRRLLDGPDNARLDELLTVPTSGIVVDPTKENVFWIFHDDADRTRAIEDIKRDLVLEPLELAELGAGETSDSSDTTFRPLALGAGCRTPGMTLYEHANLGGAQLFLTGQAPHLGMFGFDNRTSSLTFVSGIMALFEHPNITGHSIQFLPQYEIRLPNCGVSQPFGQVDSLSTVVMTSWWIFKTYWNDQASSADYAQTQF